MNINHYCLNKISCQLVYSNITTEKRFYLGQMRTRTVLRRDRSIKVHRFQTCIDIQQFSRNILQDRHSILGIFRNKHTRLKERKAKIRKRNRKRGMAAGGRNYNISHHDTNTTHHIIEFISITSFHFEAYLSQFPPLMIQMHLFSFVHGPSWSQGSYRRVSSSRRQEVVREKRGKQK